MEEKMAESQAQEYEYAQVQKPRPVQMRRDLRRPPESGGSSQSKVSFQPPEQVHWGVYDDESLLERPGRRSFIDRQRHVLSVMVPSRKRISEFFMPKMGGTVPADLPVYITLATFCCIAFGVFAIFQYLEAMKYESRGEKEKAAEKSRAALKAAAWGIAIGPFVIILFIITVCFSYNLIYKL